MIRGKQVTASEFNHISHLACTVFPGYRPSDAMAFLLGVSRGVVIDLYITNELPEPQLTLVKKLLGPNGGFIARIRAAVVKDSLKK